jgi:CHAT domain-containing protein/tetratricopeptide (TPR) repeat protein
VKGRGDGTRHSGAFRPCLFRTTLLACLALSGLASSGLCAASDAGHAGDSGGAGLAACDALFAAAPDDPASAACFYNAGKDPAVAPAARAHLERLLAASPGHPWLELNLGHLESGSPERALTLYRAAAERFAAGHDAKGEVLARSNLQRVLMAQGRSEEAGIEAERAERVAVAAGDPELVARAKIVLARHLFTLGRDLERVYLLLREAEAVAFPRGPYPLRRDCLHWLANVSVEMGRFEEALTDYRREAELARANDDRFAVATALYGLARAFLDRAAEMPRPGERETVIALARDALAAAESNRGVQQRAHWLLGMLTTGEEARRHLEACQAAAQTIREKSYCLNALARHFAAEDPPRARRAIGEALALAHQADDPWSMAYSWREQMRVSWTLAGGGSLAQAVADSHAALDAIEALRDLQAGTPSQAELFSTWSEEYAWLAGRLLQAWLHRHDRASLAEAFQIMERSRARALLDALAAARAAPPASPEKKALQSGRAALLEDIARVQRRLFDPDLPAPERRRARRELEGLELAEADLRNQLAPVLPDHSSPRAPEFVSLSEVEAALSPDEALLSFQAAPQDDLFGGAGGGGGSWVLVSTLEGTRAWPLRRDRTWLRSAVALFDGLFERRDGSEAGSAAGLYETVLGEALRSLPPRVRHLILVPDDVLHQLPFAALRATATGPPLAERFDLMEVPSATLWLRWQLARPAPARVPVLALADPLLPWASSAAPPARGEPAERFALFASGLRLGPLPFARTEGEAAVRNLGGGSVLRTGAEASEGFVKSSPLSGYGVLHFATHAVLDDRDPEHSGVLLTAAPSSEDGLLQIREIVPLALGGRVVVLSSCRSASGTVVHGEGVMGLARAFFQAGAHTVVASLWPLRDDDGAALFDRFYVHLARGLTVAASLRAAQRDRIAAGAPAFAWAGLVVLGDGDLVPLPGGRPVSEGLGWAPVLATGALSVLLLAAAVAWRRRVRVKPG